MSFASKRIFNSSGVASVLLDQAEGVSFDGSTGYLSRSTDLTGNTDSKTFTFSCWVYITNDAVGNILYWSDDAASNAFQVSVSSSGEISFIGRNAAGSIILNATPSIDVPFYTWTHFSGSFDLSNTLNRHVFVNDTEDVSVNYATFTNDLINFTNSTHRAAKRFDASPLQLQGRMAYLYLDHTYRDLTIESNRRLFITSDLKPADSATIKALSPILYFPMLDKDSAEVNEGTGGDFTVNGELDTAQRGPNQDNCVASEFDGVDDYMASTNIGASDGKQFTASFIIKKPAIDDDYLFNLRTPSLFNSLRIYTDSASNTLKIAAQNLAGTNILSGVLQTDALTAGKELQISISVDLSNPSNRAVYIEGTEVVVTWSTYTDDIIDMTVPNYYIGQAITGSSRWDGSVGELYFDTSYTDLIADNIFWDSATNKPKPIRQVLEETGNTPLIAMAISADNPGLNLGTGGDFTLNGGGLAGARGASEYIARGAAVDGTNYLTGSIFCQSLVKWLSVDSGVTWIPTYTNSVTVTDIGNGTDNGVVAYYFGTSENINWALEENKNRFTDQLGFPKDMGQVLSDNPSAVLAIDFSDTSNFGLNKAGADYTETGTVIAGADVTT